MGRDKTTLRLDGRTLVAHSAERLAAVCPVIVVADRGRGLEPGFRSVDDGPGVGPGAGLLGARIAYPDASLLALACDLPNVPVDLLRALLGLAGDLVVPRWRRNNEPLPEPLCALYRPKALDRLAQRLDQGRAALHPLTRDSDLEVRFLEGADLERFGPPRRLFANVNTPDDWEALQGS